MKTSVIIEMIVEPKNGEFVEDFKPQKAHEEDACYDIFAAEQVIIPPQKTGLIRAGFKMQLEQGWEAQIRPRSGNSLKKDMKVILGTVDCGYAGEVGVIMYNSSTCDPIVIKRKDKIAQMAIRNVPFVEMIFDVIKKETARGEGGFGSTDRK